MSFDGDDMMRKALSLLLIATPLAGCTPVDATFGGALKHNVAQQVINPDPEYAGEIVEGGNGARSAAAVDRYQKGAVKEPVRESTSESASGSGAGAGAGPR
jgi:type IV pilus biogenesis protein CpaD/CtpE